MNTEGYTKLSASILTSTIWVESDQTVRVWFTLLALTDRNGFVSGTVPGLASVARVPIEACRAAVTLFLSPDPDSRTKDHEGRRIEAVDGGWLLLNHAKYRDDRDPDSRREQTRRAVAKHRAKLKGCKPDVSQCKPEKAVVSPDKPQKAQSTSKAESEALKSSIAKSAKARREGESEFIEECKAVFGSKTMKNWGGRWRNMFREDPGKARRAVVATASDMKEKPMDNPGGYAADLYKRFA